MKFLMGLGRELKIWTLYNCINRASFLAESTVDTLGHVNIVSCGSATAIWAWLSFNCDRLSWTDSFTQLASDASLLSIRVPSQGMLSTKARTERSFLERIVQCGRFTKQVTQRHGESSQHFRHEEIRCISVVDRGDIMLCLCVRQTHIFIFSSTGFLNGSCTETSCDIWSDNTQSLQSSHTSDELRHLFF